MSKKRVMVDMSATLIHHGHVRLLKKAAEYGDVVVALTVDAEVKRSKGYKPELDFEHRKEILESIKYVKEVVPSGWHIDHDFLIQHNCDLLVHGDDNVNKIPEEKLLIFPRTQGVSSSELRQRVLDCIIELNIGSDELKNSDTVTKMFIETIKKEFKMD